MTVKAWAPNRILDFGGWTDTWFAQHGSVLNFAVDLHAQAVIISRQRRGVSISAYDFGEVVEVESPDKVVYDGHHDLLKAAVKMMGVDRANLSVYSDVPARCGTGSSAAVSVAMLGALALFAGRYHTPHEIARMAHELETKELKIESGVQDQIAAAVGGIGYHEISPYPHVSSTPVRIRQETIWELESRLLLVYTGEGRLSSDVHRKVIADYQSGQQATVEAMEELRQTPRLAANALFKGDFEEFAQVMNANNEAQKRLHPGITTPQIEEIERVAKRAGAIGFKTNGAGGGGTTCVLTASDRRRAVQDEIRQAGYQLLPFHLEFDGLRAWAAS